MIKGETKSGFSFALDEEVFDDYELLECLKEIDAGREERITEVVDLLFGEKQKKELKEHIRNEKGRVSAIKMMEEVAEIFSFCQQGKNS